MSTEQKHDVAEEHQKQVVGRTHSAWLRKLPNQLTYLRIFCIPVVVLLMLDGGYQLVNVAYEPQLSDFAAAIVFALAALTDFLDGWIARRFQVESLLGKLLDPLADKLLVVSALVILVEKQRLAGWIAVILIVRDLGINAIRISAMEEGILVPSSWIGKTKTLLLDIGIVGLAVNGTFSSWNLPFRFWGLIFIWAALAASVISALQYLWGYGSRLKAGTEPPKSGGNRI